MAQPAVPAARYPRRDPDDEVLSAPAQRPSGAGQAQPAAEARILERRGVGRAGRAVGLSIYKPTQLGWLAALFGGFQLARYWHFWIVWAFVAFSIVHVILVFVVDPASLRAMLSGWYRGRFPSHD